MVKQIPWFSLIVSAIPDDYWPFIDQKMFKRLQSFKMGFIKRQTFLSYKFMSSFLWYFVYIIKQVNNSLIFSWHVFVKFRFPWFPNFFPNSLIFPCSDFFHKSSIVIFKASVYLQEDNPYGTRISREYLTMSEECDKVMTSGPTHAMTHRAPPQLSPCSVSQGL